MDHNVLHLIDTLLAFYTPAEDNEQNNNTYKIAIELRNVIRGTDTLKATSYIIDCLRNGEVVLEKGFVNALQLITNKENNVDEFCYKLEEAYGVEKFRTVSHSGPLANVKAVLILQEFIVDKDPLALRNSRIYDIITRKYNE